ncbi:hypothetical protein GCM10007094_28930 [Pseudovibrio japonicus]|uniref:Methyltransferase FkbM domain-containing protein n=1 Tax=Pseudovibrio japonicus TaxID=366534 RepID=A0ABQ3EM40_9HYPH|nr:FkbM family methyltransferase [Pseudovibrio japonicus]GHB37818.1 hypothetical protein GCM10007094_28930 [Pseudovibrio japonicus]
MDLKKSIRKRVARLAGIPFYKGQETSAESLRRFAKLAQPKMTDFELIRIGGAGDGGYLIPDDLEGISACFSPGVGPFVRFEEELAGRGIPSFLVDASVDRPPVDNPKFSFQKKYLGVEDSGDYIRLDSWLEQSAPNKGDLLLQMDIECGEYDVLFDSDQSILSRFRIIVIEFHDLPSLLDPIAFKLFYHIFRRLLENFEVVHIHPNNCALPVRSKNGFAIPPVMEFTFLRRDRIENSRPANTFPHPLDEASTAKSDYALPSCWYDF